ncbi:MAG: type II CAAX endopeptidase family protein [Candidatus Calescibacterium sp.]|nr:CPBP family intramembrane metalloprotease [Candidatus Calescibacterium sp.]MDW8132631.1 type II CAAX endopeptidase family protein [Candidatus Calescibacterium sp.]
MFFYFLNNFANFDVKESNSDDVYLILTDKHRLIDFYEVSNFDNQQDKVIFGYFVLIFILISLYLVIRTNNKKEVSYNYMNFYFLFFGYYFMQIFLQFLGINVIFSLLSTFVNDNLMYEIMIAKIILLFSVVIGAPLIVLGILHKYNRIDLFSFLNNLFFLFKKDYIVLILLFCCTLIMFILTIVYFFVLGDIDYRNLGLLVIYIKYAGIYELVFGFLGIVFFVPLVEELMFRKYLMDYLLNFFNRWLVVFFSSLIFALVHFESIINTILIFFMGVFLSFVYLIKRDIIYTYILHSFYNFLSMIFWVYID